MAVAAVLACAAPLRAHHSISTIDIATPVWLEGVVVEYTVVNPHVMLIVEKSGGERWTVEGPGLGRLARLGLADDFLKLGDQIEVCGFFPKSNAVSSYPPPRFVHGHLLLLARGALQPWGPYGKLDNCYARANPSGHGSTC